MASRVETLTSYLNTLVSKANKQLIKNKCDSELHAIIKTNRGFVQNLVGFELQQEFKNYLGNKFIEEFGVDFEQKSEYKSMFMNSNGRLEIDPQRWDLPGVINIMVAFFDFPMIKNDFIINEKHENTIKLKQRLRDIKMIRNKFSHSHDIDARELYEHIDNITRFFEQFKEGMPNDFSKKKV